MKLISWNVNGIRSAVKKDFIKTMLSLDADIFCVQETKAQDDQVKEALSELEGYHLYMNSAVKKGYSGTAIMSRKEPLDVSRDIGVDIHDQEGRVLCAEYGDFYFVSVYVPNSGQGLARLDYRKEWDQAFLRYLKNLDAKKPVICSGDFNVAHRPIDLARPKDNYNKSAGYTQLEIDGMDAFTNAGFCDTFRYLHPDEVAYSWWSWRMKARERNVGWRIDYFLVSSVLVPEINEASILGHIHGSDHCPVQLIIK